MCWRNLHLAVSRFLDRLEEEKGEKERSNSSRKERGGQRGGEGGKQEGEFSLTFEAAQGAGRQ